MIVVKKNVILSSFFLDFFLDLLDKRRASITSPMMPSIICAAVWNYVIQTYVIMFCLHCNQFWSKCGQIVFG